MKKILALLLIASFLFCGTAFAAFEDHPESQNIKTLTKSLITKVRNRQADYFAMHKRYFQGLKIPSVGDCDGVVGKFIDFGKRPSDQVHSWNDFDGTNFNQFMKLPVHIKVDVYETPDSGWGWMLTVEFKYDGLGPDKYGNDGDHWMYIHDEGGQMTGGIYGDWFIKTEM